MKGNPTEQELEEGDLAARELGGRIVTITNVPMLPEMRATNRNLVILEKVRDTPQRYPRRVGSAKTQPLGKK